MSEVVMTIAIGNDHTASEFKKPIIKYLQENEFKVLDLGTNGSASVDYPDFGTLVAQKVVNKEADLGIIICGTGIGISIAANRVHGARAALCYEEETARLSRSHNNANILALGARIIAVEKAIEIISVFLSTAASEDPRHVKRVEKLN